MKNIDEITKIVSEEIDNWDPLGLLKLGAPGDEYETEITIIVKGLPNCKSESDLSKLIQSTLDSTFGPDLYEYDSQTSKSIWDRINI
jgi:hypothetical protein